jgi:hypothetical protein
MDLTKFPRVALAHLPSPLQPYGKAVDRAGIRGSSSPIPGRSI